MENLPILKNIDMSNNKITDISFLENLTNLEVIKLKNNNISYIPECISKIKDKLSYIDLSDNPIGNT
jgi:Leucine-rich repeat (LRR) protein